MIQWVGTDNGPCADGPPKGRTWFKLQVIDLEVEINQPLESFIAFLAKRILLVA